MLHACWMNRGSLVRTWLLVIAGCAVLLASTQTAAHGAAKALTADLSMSLSDGGTQWTAQSNQQSTTPSGTWTLTVRNTGTAASSGTTTIIFSAYSTGKFLPSTGKGWSCDDTNAVVHTCTNRTSVGAGGALEPLSFPWVAFGGYGYAYATATLSNPSSHNATHATASIYTPVVQQPAVDMSMSLSDRGAPWTAQSNQQSTTPSGTWTLRVRNTGTVASSGTTTIVFSAYSTGKFLPSTGKGWSCDDTNAVVRTCTSGWSVAPGGALPPLSLPWVSLPGYGYAYATATLSNQRNGTINHSTASIYTPVVEQPAVDLSMSLSDGGTPWTEQANPATTTTPSGTWTLDVRNTGTVASSGTTTVTFDAQSAGDYLQSSGQDWACADNGATLTCTNPDAVPAGGTLPPLSVPWATSSGGYAEASVTLANPSDGTINHASSSILTPVSDSSAADVVATISDGGQPFTAGQQAVYTITVSNAGTSPASGPTTVYYPVPFAGTVAAGTGWTCTPSDVASPDCSYSGGIAAGSALPPITLTASVPAQDAPASVQAATYVDNPNDTFQNDNGAHLVTDVTPLPIDVVATISDGGAPFTAGQNAVYTIRVRNTGTSPASGTTTVDYPVVFSGAVAAGTGWTCTPSDVTTPECSHSGGIAAGSALPPITVTTAVPAQDAPATVRATVNVENSSDAFTNDNFSILDTDITPRPVDVTADISDGGVPFATGHTAIYTVQVRNTGTSPARGTTTVYYPVPFPGAVAEGTGWTCTPSSVSNPFCSNPSPIPAKSALPPLTIHAVVPSQDPSAETRAE